MYGEIVVYNANPKVAKSTISPKNAPMTLNGLLEPPACMYPNEYNKRAKIATKPRIAEVKGKLKAPTSKNST